MRFTWELDETPVTVEVLDWTTPHPGQTGPSDDNDNEEPGYLFVRVRDADGDEWSLDDDEFEELWQYAMSLLFPRGWDPDEDEAVPSCADGAYYASRAEDSWSSGRGY
jgi:hypothetical protein